MKLIGHERNETSDKVKKDVHIRNLKAGHIFTLPSENA